MECRCQGCKCAHRPIAQNNADAVLELLRHQQAAFIIGTALGLSNGATKGSSLSMYEPELPPTGPPPATVLSAVMVDHLQAVLVACGDNDSMRCVQGNARREPKCCSGGICAVDKISSPASCKGAHHASSLLSAARVRRAAQAMQRTAIGVSEPFSWRCHAGSYQKAPQNNK